MKIFYAVFIVLAMLFSVTIAYSEEKGHLVKDSVLMKDVSGALVTNANLSGCHALKGDEARITDKRDYVGVKDYWIEVEILSGSCTGEKGWIMAEKFSN